MIRFKLSLEDRERLGCPEVIEFNEGKLLLSEARMLQRASGFHPSDFIDGLKKGNVDALAAVVWLAMHRAGIDVSFDELDFDLSAFEEVPDEELGKADPG